MTLRGRAEAEIRHSVGDDECPNKFPYKLYLCLDDRPGSFIQVFKTLINKEEGSSGRLYIDLHSFSLAPCERFSRLPWKIAINESVRRIVRVRKKYKLHSIVFVRESGDEDIHKASIGIGIKGMLEIHACIVGDNVLDTVIGLINALNNGIAGIIRTREGDKRREKETGRGKEEVLYRALIITPIKARISKQIECRAVLKRKLAEILVRNGEQINQNWCPERGTCPIAAAIEFLRERHASELMERLWLSSLMDAGRQNERSVYPPKNTSPDNDGLSYICDAYFIRDHEDYTEDRTFLEIYGVCQKKVGLSKEHTPSDGKWMDNVNILLINKVWWGLSDDEFRNFIEGLVGDNSLDEEIVSPFSSTNFIKIEKAEEEAKEGTKDVIIINKHFFCDDLYCDILRHFRMSINFEGGSNG